MKLPFLKLALAVLIFVMGQKTALAQQEKALNFLSVETPPSYPGGMANFYKLIINHLNYPAAAKKNNIEGMVLVSFTIEKDGTLDEIEVQRSLGYCTDEEAVRVLKLSEKWKPGIQKGQAVRVKYNLPIKFANKK